jgi:glycosyltransferase involved in cell wall biosynthesis
VVNINSSKPAVTIVIPAHNSSVVIVETLQTLGLLDLPVGSQIVVIENGSTDGTSAVLKSINLNWASDVDLKIASSEKGFGNAVSYGVALADNSLIFITGDDLPFGTADLTHALEVFSPDVVIIGSKLHPESKVERSKGRQFQTHFFRILRIMVLNTRVSDSQGTFLIEKKLLIDFLQNPRHTGFLWTTELVHFLEQKEIEIREIPVCYDSNLDTKVSSTRFSSSVWLAFDLFRIRYRSRREKMPD